MSDYDDVAVRHSDIPQETFAGLEHDCAALLLAAARAAEATGDAPGVMAVLLEAERSAHRER
jgi:hypothetical protein